MACKLLRELGRKLENNLTGFGGGGGYRIGLRVGAGVIFHDNGQFGTLFHKPELFFMLTCK